jgi:hypothetical protein
MISGLSAVKRVGRPKLRIGTWTRRNLYNPIEPQGASVASFVRSSSSRNEIVANFPRAEQDLRFVIDHFKDDRVVLVRELAQVFDKREHSGPPALYRCGA